MKPIRLVLSACVLSLFAPVALSQRVPDPRIEIYIPVPMEKVVQIEATRDEKEQTITKYNIRRVCGPEVDKVFMVCLTIGPDNKVGEGSGAIEQEAHITTARVWEPASIAWISSVDVRRLILTIERVETDTGVWVLDNEDQHVNVRAIVERGSDALPSAKFIKGQ